MKKLILALAIAILSPLAARAQTTLVTGTVTDPNGVPYANAKLTVNLSPATPGPYTLTINNQAQCTAARAGTAPCQVPFTPSPSTITLSPAGSFTVTVQDNTQITPSGTQWIFNISIYSAPPVGVGQVSFAVTATISGASQSVSSTLSAAAPALTYVTSGASNPGGNAVYASTYVTALPATVVTDASTTNNQNTISCPNSDCKFLTDKNATIGNTIFATGSSCQAGGLALAETTILSITDNNHLTTTGNAAATENGTACLVYGTLAETSAGTGQFYNAWNALMNLAVSPTNGVPTLFLPCGAYLVEGAITSNVNANVGIVGCPQGGTTFIRTPNFGWSSCNVYSCFFYSSGSVTMSDVNVTNEGANVSAACSSTAYNDFRGNNVAYTRVSVYNDCLTAGNITPMWLLQTSYCDHCSIIGAANASTGVALQINVNGYPVTLIDANVSSGGIVNVSSSSSAHYGWQWINSFSGLYGEACNSWEISSPYIAWNSFGDNFGGINVSGANSNDVFTLYGSSIIPYDCGATAAIAFGTSGATVRLYGSSTVDAGTEAGTNYDFTGTGNVIGDGSEHIVPGGSGLFSSGTINYATIGNHMIYGMCSGTATASTTLGLYGTGPNETTTSCTSTTIGSGMVMPKSGTVKYLTVVAGTAGHTSSSGVFTVMLNHAGGGLSTTTVTCTVGTGTFCQDSTHSFAVSAGDLVSIEFSTVAGETLANVQAYVGMYQ